MNNLGGVHNKFCVTSCTSNFTLFKHFATNVYDNCGYTLDRYIIMTSSSASAGN